MLFKLIVLFTALPVLDLWLLIKLGKTVGTWPAIILIIGTGLLGASMVKAQGLLLFTKIRGELMRGRMPTQELINGVGVLSGAILLVTPGIITDLCGLILLFPPTRRLAMEAVMYWVRKKYFHEGFLLKHITRSRERADDDEF